MYFSNTMDSFVTAVINKRKSISLSIFNFRHKKKCILYVIYKFKLAGSYYVIVIIDNN